MDSSVSLRDGIFSSGQKTYGKGCRRKDPYASCQKWGKSSSSRASLIRLAADFPAASGLLPRQFHHLLRLNSIQKFFRCLEPVLRLHGQTL